MFAFAAGADAGYDVIMRRIIMAICIMAALGGVASAYAQTTQTTVTFDDETRKFLANLFHDTWFKKETIGSTVLGGLLAIAGGVAAATIAELLRATHKKRDEAEFCKNLLRAIRCEVDALHQIHNTGIGKAINEVKDGELFMMRLALTEDWFTVFSSNAANLGRLEGEVSLQIVTVYMLMKKLIEQYRINNKYLDELDVNQNMGRASQIQGNMISQVPRIKEADVQLKKAKLKLIELLDARGIK